MMKVCRNIYQKYYLCDACMLDVMNGVYAGCGKAFPWVRCLFFSYTMPQCAARTQTHSMQHQRLALQPRGSVIHSATTARDCTQSRAWKHDKSLILHWVKYLEISIGNRLYQYLYSYSLGRSKMIRHTKKCMPVVVVLLMGGLFLLLHHSSEEAHPPASIGFSEDRLNVTVGQDDNTMPSTALSLPAERSGTQSDWLTVLYWTDWFREPWSKQ